MGGSREVEPKDNREVGGNLGKRQPTTAAVGKIAHLEPGFLKCS